MKKLKKTSFFNSRLAMLSILLFAVIGAYFIVSAYAAKPNRTTAAVTLSLTSSSQRVKVGESFSVDIKLNTNNESVNVVDAKLTYPADKVEFVSIDTSGSSFEIDVPSSGGNGTVSVARATLTPQNSSSLSVARVNFKAIASGRKVPLSFGTSEVIRAEDSIDILQKTTGLQYTIQ